MSEKLPVEDPIVVGSVAWCESIVRNADLIYVRAEVASRFKTVLLADLPPEQQAKFICQWLAEGRSVAR